MKCQYQSMVKIPRIIPTVIVNCWLKRPGTSYSSSCESCLSIEWILSRNDTSRHRFPVNRIEGNVTRRAGSNARLKFKGESCCTQRGAIDRWIKETSRTMSETIPMVLWQILCRRQPIIQRETRKICRLVAKVEIFEHIPFFFPETLWNFITYTRIERFRIPREIVWRNRNLIFVVRSEILLIVNRLCFNNWYQLSYHKELVWIIISRNWILSLKFVLDLFKINLWKRAEGEYCFICTLLPDRRYVGRLLAIPRLNNAHYISVSFGIIDWTKTKKSHLQIKLYRTSMLF